MRAVVDLDLQQSQALKSENKLDAVLIKEGAAPLITTESMRVSERVLYTAVQYIETSHLAAHTEA